MPTTRTPIHRRTRVRITDETIVAFRRAREIERAAVIADDGCRYIRDADPKPRGFATFDAVMAAPRA